MEFEKCSCHHITNHHQSAHDEPWFQEHLKLYPMSNYDKPGWSDWDYPKYHPRECSCFPCRMYYGRPNNQLYSWELPNSGIVRTI